MVLAGGRGRQQRRACSLCWSLPWDLLVLQIGLLRTILDRSSRLRPSYALLSEEAVLASAVGRKCLSLAQGPEPAKLEQEAAD